MNILVTGGCGFIGSHLVDILIESNHTVWVFDNLYTGNKDNVNKKAIFCNIDIGELIPKYYNVDFEVIFHLAAEPRIQPSWQNVIGVNKTNVLGTLAILELARQIQSRVIFTSSSSVGYNAKNPYTYSKFLGEQYCEMYRNFWGLSVVVTRLFNVYGERQIEEGDHATVMGIFEKHKRENKKLPVTDNANTKRDFVYVKDVVNCLVKIMDKNLDLPLIEIGSGKNHSVYDLARMFNQETILIGHRPGEVTCNTLANINVIKNLLDWEPKQTIENYIDEVLQINQQERI